MSKPRKLNPELSNEPNGVTTQMKALDEYILMALFVLSLKRVNFLQTKPQGVTTQMKALDEYILMVVLTLLLNRVHVFANFTFNWTEKHGSEGVHIAVRLSSDFYLFSRCSRSGNF